MSGLAGLARASARVGDAANTKNLQILELNSVSAKSCTNLLKNLPHATPYAIKSDSNSKAAILANR